MNEIIVGAIASLIASIILFWGGRLISTRKSREKISFLLEMLYDCADQFDTAMIHGLTNTAEVQADKILELCARIREETMCFTFFGKKKKLFNTILYNLYYTISYYKRVNVGYSGETERAEILNKFKRKYYYSIPIYNKDRKIDDKRSFLMFSVTLLQALNNQNSVKNALYDNYFIHKEWNGNLKDTYSKLIVTSNFKANIPLHKYDLRKKIFTKDEYNKYITDKLRGDKQ